jgi:large subunit ribosomal protein L1
MPGTNGAKPSIFLLKLDTHHANIGDELGRSGMASTHQSLASMARLTLTAASRPAVTTIPRFLAPPISAPIVRHASAKTTAKKESKFYRLADLTKLDQYSLCDAMR